MGETGPSRQRCFDIRPLSATGAAALAAGMVRIDPWARLGFETEKLVAAMASDDGRVVSLEARVDGAPAGLITYLPGWLYGPYIRLLAVLPRAQGRGLGRALVDRLADDTRKLGQANIWVCASAFNRDAVAFYERLGFRRIGMLDGLVVANEDEVLLRWRL